MAGCLAMKVVPGESLTLPPCAVNVVPDSQRCQKMNPHLTAIYISSYRYSAHVRKARSYVIRVRSSSRAAPGKGARPLPGSAATDLR